MLTSMLFLSRVMSYTGLYRCIPFSFLFAFRSIMSRYVLVACLLVAAVSFVLADDKVNDPDVVVLTKDNFEEFSNRDLALVGQNKTRKEKQEER